MDGFEVCATFTCEASTAGALLVAVTGYGHEEVGGQAKQAGFDHHMLKPLDLNALLALVSSAVSDGVASELAGRLPDFES